MNHIAKYVESHKHGKTRRLAVIAIRIARRRAADTATANDIYDAAWKLAKSYQNYVFNKQYPRWINIHGKKGRAIMASAANTMRARDGALHDFLVQGVLALSSLPMAKAQSTAGDFYFDGKLCESKVSLRERKKQIFADGQTPQYVFVRGVESDSAITYVTKHAANLVVCDPNEYARVAHVPGVRSLSGVMGAHLKSKIGA